MSQFRYLPILVVTSIASAALIASDISATAATAPSAKPTTRLGAELSTEMDASKQDVAKRAQTVDMQRRLLEATSTRVKGQAAAAQAQTAAQSKQEASQQQEDESVLQLVKVYQSMKPAPAARIFERLDIGIQVAVASKMRAPAMAKLMAAMSPETATRLTTALADPASANRPWKALSPASAPVLSSKGPPVGSPPKGPPSGSPLKR